jgi:hypothetical protein
MKQARQAAEREWIGHSQFLGVGVVRKGEKIKNTSIGDAFRPKTLRKPRQC